MSRYCHINCRNHISSKDGVRGGSIFLYIVSLHMVNDMHYNSSDGLDEVLYWEVLRLISEIIKEHSQK